MQGRRDEARDLLAPDVEWVEPPDVPDQHVVRGRAEALAAVEDWLAAWRDYELELVELVEAGDRVLAALRQTAHGAGSGLPVAGDLFMVWTLRDGVPVRMEMFLDRPRAEAAAGLAAGQAPRPAQGSANLGL